MVSVYVSSSPVSTITVERIMGLDCAFAQFSRAQKERTSSLTNGFGFTHQKRFYKNLKINFLEKIYKKRKKC